jgi:hypothetical protein
MANFLSLLIQVLNWIVLHERYILRHYTHHGQTTEMYRHINRLRANIVWILNHQPHPSVTPTITPEP